MGGTAERLNEQKAKGEQSGLNDENDQNEHRWTE
jgi:hypothetical protein